MSDHELLNLAAKAAGITLDSDGDRVDVRDNGGAPTAWNPLTDDGDALRLAITLGIGTYPREAHAWCEATGGLDNLTRVGVSHCADVFSATRRAVVVAAAEIGRAML
jgi:hypothetical protein